MATSYSQEQDQLHLKLSEDSGSSTVSAAEAEAKPKKPRASAKAKTDAKGEESTEEKPARKPSSKSSQSSRLTAAELKAREAEARAKEAEAKAREAEARAREAMARAAAAEAGGKSLGNSSQAAVPMPGSREHGQQKSGGGTNNNQNQGGGSNRNKRGRKYDKYNNNKKRKNRNRRRNRNDRGGGGGQQNRGGNRDSGPDRSLWQDPDADPTDTSVNESGTGEGIIEISGKGFGFLREKRFNYDPTPSDVFVTPELIRKYNLRDGMKLEGETRKGNRGPQLHKLNKVNGEPPEHYIHTPSFEELTVLNPMERIKLETEPNRFTTRVIDLMTPIGKGQRGLIVSPPRSGKTTILQQIAEAVTENYPDMPLIILLIDERPEEVTEMRRAFPKAEVLASSNDSDTKSHTRIAQLAIERAKRLVEAGEDVFMLLDSITRMARAFNNASGGGGKTGSGGVDLKAMELPRKIFASARNTEEAGSMTIIASALVETGSRMDDYIFQEFKGTGNMEVVLDRKLADQLIFPAIDILKSGTRREELILPEYMLDKIATVRRGLAGTKPSDAIQRLLMYLQKFPTNFEMITSIPDPRD